jgi:ATP-binding cassette subfamily C protein CydD
LRQALFVKILDLGPIQLQQFRTGEIASQIGQGVDRLDPYFRTYLPQLGLAAMIPLTIMGVVFPVDWLTGLIFLLTAPLIPLFMVLIGKEAEKETERQWKLLSRLSGHFLDVLQGIRTLKTFGLSGRQGKVIRDVSEEYASVTLGVLRIAFLSALTLELLATISTAIVAVQIGLRLLNGGLTFANALFVLILAPEFYQPLRQLGASFHSGMDGVSAAEKIFEFLSREQLVDASPSLSLPLPQRLPRQEIIFEDVWYSYPARSEPVLRGLSLTIPAGKQTVIIGRSGAGKTTILSLLMKFVEPGAGDILVGNTNLVGLSGQKWRQQIAWVPQAPYLFQGSISDNIRIGNPGATPSEVESAAQRALAYEFISGLNDGFETLVGERGARLSGGQAQRIAIARAFLKDAPILLLDEPTTGIDQETQTKIFDILADLKRDRTVIHITHRFSSIRQADLLVYIQDGRVVQAGQPSELASVPGQVQALLENKRADR